MLPVATKSEVTEEVTYVLTPTLKFTEAQKNNTAKLYSLKDIFDSCAKVSQVEEEVVQTQSTEVARG